MTPAFFDTLRIPLRLGRVFSAEDRAGQPAVVVVNEAFVRFLAADKYTLRSTSLDTIAFSLSPGSAAAAAYEGAVSQ